MTETALIRPQTGPESPAEPGTEPFRPASPARGPGRWLRRIAGVDEAILDWVPEERPRYTWQGAILLNTAIMAGISMIVLLSRTDVPTLLAVPLALLWGGLILTFDGWLVASTHGVSGRGRLAVYLPRILISILMGVVIAEPLLLAAFAPAIRTQIAQERRQSLDAYENTLRECNPISGEAVPAAACTERLNVENPLVSIRNDLSRTTASHDAAQAQLRQVNAELSKREAVSRAECNGTKIKNTTTGRAGEGPNCARDRKEADRFRASAGIDARQAAIDTMERDIAKLTADEATAGRGYAAALHTKIDERVAEARAAQQRIGILDEDRALSTLAGQSRFVAVGSWLLRLLLIVVDCLPVLTKLLSRSTTYDALLSRQLTITDRLHDRYATAREQRYFRHVDLSDRRDQRDFRTSVEALDAAEAGGRDVRQGLDTRQGPVGNTSDEEPTLPLPLHHGR